MDSPGTPDTDAELPLHPLASYRLLAINGRKIFRSFRSLASKGAGFLKAPIRGLDSIAKVILENPLGKILASAVVGYSIFLLQTQVQREIQLQQARFTALQETTGLYGQMLANLDELERTRCEAMSGVLTASDLKLRSSEIQSRLSKTREIAETTKLKIAVLFSPAIPFYERGWNALVRKISGPKYRPKDFSPSGDNSLHIFQEFNQLYVVTAGKAVQRASVIPKGIPCSADDVSYLAEFKNKMEFKLFRIYNLMAPSIGVTKLEIHLRTQTPPPNVQRFNALLSGSPGRIECDFKNNSMVGQCRIVRQ